MAVAVITGIAPYGGKLIQGGIPDYENPSQSTGRWRRRRWDLDRLSSGQGRLGRCDADRTR